jgi:hypothetical protein
MRLLLAALVTLLVGAGIVLASPRPHLDSPRPQLESPRLLQRQAVAERFCKAQGRDCRILSRSLTGLSCVCR